MEHEHLQGAAILVMANKQDLKDAMKVEELTQVLSLHAIKQHDWHIQVRPPGPTVWIRHICPSCMCSSHLVTSHHCSGECAVSACCFASTACKSCHASGPIGGACMWVRVPRALHMVRSCECPSF